MKFFSHINSYIYGMKITFFNSYELDMNLKVTIHKTGSCYYINTKILFDNLKLDYSKGNV